MLPGSSHSVRRLGLVALLVAAASAGFALADPDGDGLSSAAEVTDGTAPLRADTDGDGLDDGREVALALDPTDEAPREFVGALELAKREYPDHTRTLATGIYRGGPSPGEVTRFEQRQLRLWVAAPPNLRRTILAGGHLHADDWDRDGGPQTEPDGSPGIDDDPFRPNDGDGDGVLRWFYNADGVVYDPATDAYQGFRPSEDLVGELGDRDAHGGLAPLGADPARFDLFVEVDYMAAGNHSNEPGRAVVDAIVETYAGMGIRAHVVVDERLPHRNTTSVGDGLPRLHARYLADHRRGVFVHGLYIHGTSLNGLQTGGYGQSNRSIGEFSSVDWQSTRQLDSRMYIDTLREWQTRTPIHEIGHVGGLVHPESLNSPKTVMGPPLERPWLLYTDDELETFKATIGEMPYYRPLTAGNATGRTDS